MVTKLKTYFFLLFFSPPVNHCFTLHWRMNYNCEVNEIIAYLTVSLFASEICTDMTNEVRGKAVSPGLFTPFWFFFWVGIFCGYFFHFSRPPRNASYFYLLCYFKLIFCSVSCTGRINPQSLFCLPVYGQGGRAS